VYCKFHNESYFPSPTPKPKKSVKETCSGFKLNNKNTLTKCGKTSKLVLSEIDGKKYCKKHYGDSFKSSPLFVPPTSPTPSDTINVESTNSTNPSDTIKAEPTNSTDPNPDVKDDSETNDTDNKTIQLKHENTNNDSSIQPIKHENICHAVNCKMYDQLIDKHKGKWCIFHLKIISKLRKIIKRHKGDYDELVARFFELKLRKNIDEGHTRYILELALRHQKMSRVGSAIADPTKNYKESKIVKDMIYDINYPQLPLGEEK
jgi:hypothetical protein